MPARQVAAGEVYGGRDLRTRIRELGYGYAVAVSASHRVTTPAGRFTVTSLLAGLPRKAWQRLRAGHGTKGDRHYDWAMIEAGPDDTPPGHDPGHSVLLARRHRYTGELSFLPLPLHRPRRPGRPRRGGLHKVADRRGHPCREIPDRTRPRPGDLLELLDALEPDQPDRRRSPGRRPRPHPVSPLAARDRPDPSDQARTAGPSASRSPPRAPPRPAAHPALVTEARRHQHRAATCHRRWNDIIAAATI
jgi:hypothetical protein